MRAIWAILKDSMREAIASRVLAVAVIAILVVLVLLSPLSLPVGASTGLRPYEVPDVQKLAQRLADESETPNTPAAHIWSLLTEDQRKAFQIVASPEETEEARSNGRRVAGRGELLQILNEAFGKSEFFKPEVFASVDLPEELKSSDEALSKQELSGKNLKRFTAAFKDVVSLQSDSALSLSYGSIQIFGPLPVPPQQRDRIINEAIIAVLGLFLGFLGIFTSVIVTAAIVPRSLEPGEISLLLSKPIRRSVLFLTKFLGGCVFTMICALLLVGGVWLILWLRMGIWKPELLLCIPLYIFLFAIYSSVSSLAGVIWRNTTVSLVVVVLFWILMTTAGSVHDFMAYVNLPPKQISEITTAGDKLFAMHRGRTFSRWDAESADWVTIMESSNSNLAMRQFEQMASSSSRIRISATPDGQRLLTFNPESNRLSRAAQASLISGRESEGFMREVEGTTPDPVYSVCVDRAGRILLPGNQSILEFHGTTDKEKQIRNYLGDTLGGILVRRRSETFTSISAKWEKKVAPEAGVAFNRADDSFVYWDDGRLWTVVRKEDGSYAEGASKTFEPASAAVIGAGGQLIIAALADGRLLAIDSVTFGTLAESKLDADEKPRIAEVAPNGQFGAVLTHSGKIYWFSMANKTFELWSPKPMTASAISFAADSTFFIGEGRQVTKFNPENRTVVQTFSGKISTTESLYKTVVKPIYLLLPKPRELDVVVRHLVTGESSEVVSTDDSGSGMSQQEDLNQYRVTRDLRQAFLSTSAFIAVMLGVSCVILMRADF